MGAALLTCAGWLAPLHAATPGVDAPPTAQPARAVAVPTMAEQRLANGLTVAVTERHDVPLVSIVLLVRAGPEQDGADRAGLAALTAALLTKGVQRGKTSLSASALAQQAENLGSTLDSASGWRASSLSMTVTSAHLPAALGLMAQALRAPTLAADELERARAQAQDDLRLVLGDPAEVAGQVMQRAFWGASPYGANPSSASLARIGRADVQRFYARFYRPEQTVLLLAGDVTAAGALALAQSLLGDWKAGAATEAAVTLPPESGLPASSLPRLVRVDMPGSGQTGVVVAAPFAAADAPDRRVGQVANAVLGGGYSARLNQKVRIDAGKSYGAFSRGESQPGAGMLVASAQTQHASAAEVLRLLRGEISRMTQAPPGTDELAARQSNLVGSFARRLGSSGGLAALMLGQYAQGRPLDELRGYVEAVLAVTPDQVHDFARSHWRADALRAVVAGDLQAAGPALDEPGALTLPVSALDLQAPLLTRSAPSK